MRPAFTDRRYNSQPLNPREIDRTRGYDEYFYYPVLGDKFYAAREEVFLTKTGSGAISADSYQRALIANGSTSFALPSSFTLAYPWTISFRARGTAGSNNAVVCGDTTATTSFIALRNITSGSPDDTHIDFRATGGAGGGTITYTNPESQAITGHYIFAADSSGFTSFYKNGVLVSKDVTNNQTPVINALGDGYSGGAFTLTGAIEFLHIIKSYELQQGEAAKLAANPYQVLRKRTRRFFFDTGQSLSKYYPGIDITVGSWTTSTGSGTLSSMVDETVADDTDYIKSGLNPVGDVAEVQFLNVQTPNANTSHTVSYRIKGDASTQLVVALIAGDGSTIVKSWTHNPAPTSFTQYDQSLSTVEADSWAAAGYPGSRLRLTAG